MFTEISQKEIRLSDGRTNIKSIVATIGPAHDRPWWWSELNHEDIDCELHYARFSFKKKTFREFSNFEILSIFIKVLIFLMNKRSSKFDYIFTFECDLVGWAIAFWQTMLRIRKPKHIILQFIMREKQQSLKSSAKYLLMRILLSSVYKFVCSSKNEITYYPKVFKMDEKRFAFIPFHTSEKFLEINESISGLNILSAGRSYRDYGTLLRAVEKCDTELLIVGGEGSVEKYYTANKVKVLENIPQEELKRKMAQAAFIILPLEDREISIGQSILLQAMAMGKAVIVTRTAGTKDYIENGLTGIFVNPKDSEGISKAINILLYDEQYRRALGVSAKEAVRLNYLPKHYVRNVKKAIT